MTGENGLLVVFLFHNGSMMRLLTTKCGMSHHVSELTNIVLLYLEAEEGTVGVELTNSISFLS